MATVISTINLKGGVGKTTLTVAIAEFLVEAFHKRVLVIDLDPQTNATVMLIGEEKWGDLNKKGYTLATLFNDGIEGKSDFNRQKTLQKKTSNVSAVQVHGKLHLLPSSLDLISIQDRIAETKPGSFHAVTPTNVLYREINSILDDYDYVLIDCPPNLGYITLNGLLVSDGYIIPTIPDFLSTYGIPQIIARVREFSNDLGRKILPYGIIISKSQGNSTHQNIAKGLRDNNERDPSKHPRVFDSVIKQAKDVADSAEFTSLNTMRQKYGGGDRYNAFRLLTEEIMEAAQ